MPETRRRWLAVLALAPVIALTSCSSSANSTRQATGGSTLVAAWPSDVSTMDPGDGRTDQDKELAMNVYQNLVGYRLESSGGTSVSKGLASTPAVASSWVIKGDTVTFTLRTDLKFSSGNPLTAKDVVWSLRRALQLNGVVELNNSGVFKPKQITAPDDTHVAIRYEDGNGKAIRASEVNIATLRTCWYGIIDSETAKKHVTGADPIAKNWLKANVAGSGPYYVKARQIGQSLDLAAAPGAVLDPPAYRAVTVRVVNNGNVASLLRGHSVDVALYGLSPRDTSALKAGGFRVAHADTSSYLYLQMASDAGPFKNPLVRQAVANALPYDRVIKDVYFGQAKRAESYVAQSAPGYTPAWQAYGDTAKAAGLMKQAGSPSISTRLRYPSDDPTYATVAQYVKDALKPLGIDVKLEPQTSAAMFNAIIGRATSKSAGSANDGMVLFGLTAYVEDAKTPVKLWSVTGGVVNFARSSLTKVDDLQNRYAMAPPGAERDKAYAEIQTLVAEDASFVPIALTGRTLVTSSDVSNLTFTPEPVVLYWTLKPAR